MRVVPFAATALCAAGMVAGVLTTNAARGQDSAASAQDHTNFYVKVEVARVDRGFAIAPVPLKYAQKDKYLVGLGSYLVNGGGCSDCHTNPPFAKGGDPYLGQKKKINTAGYLAGGQVFGPFVSRNLTPENGLPAGRTYAEFVKEMRTGIDLDHAHPQFGPAIAGNAVAKLSELNGQRPASDLYLPAVHTCDYPSQVSCRSIKGGYAPSLFPCRCSLQVLVLMSSSGGYGMR